VSNFEEFRPSNESYWRAIVLFGQNSASYKFALAKTLLQLADEKLTRISLEDLAAPFAANVISHMKLVDKQGQRPTGPFLDTCRAFIKGEATLEKLHAVTVQRGFDNVIDAFHVVNRGKLPVSFFKDERNTKRPGLVITDNLLELSNSIQAPSLPMEAEARWRLVETAWELNIGRNLLQVKSDSEFNLYVESSNRRRRPITSSRDALNGYQKGKCFYCFRDITLDGAEMTSADVDHFFAWSLGRDNAIAMKTNLDGVWNLVLACVDCNRGPAGKFAKVPERRFVDRLQRRNNFLISSHHPLRETLIAQMGATEAERAAFLGERLVEARERLIHEWRPAPSSEEAEAF
jgi:hypothetical protein